MMNTARIRELRLAEPFRQFYLILRDGRRFFIDEPYHLAMAPDGSHLIVIPKGMQSVHVTADQVADVDVLYNGSR